VRLQGRPVDFLLVALPDRRNDSYQPGRAQAVRLAVLVPDASELTYRTVWPVSFEAYRAVLASVGIEAIPLPWTSPLPADVDAAAALLAWGYHTEPERWLSKLRDWPAGVPLINPPTVLAWNTRKTYLAELAQAGAPVVPTLVVEGALTDIDLAEARARFATDTLVAKPIVAASAYRTLKLGLHDAAPASVSAVLVQPFMAAVADEGEYSLFHFGGRFSHAVRKVAAAGDFRVQAEYGGAQTPAEAPGEALEAAAKVLALAPGPLAYARVDMVRGPDGQFLLMELELIEPELYLGMAPDGGRAFAQALVEAVQR
jgi:hypothetical protein